MRILLVEDHLEFAGVVEKAIRAIDGCDVVWTQSRASALAALADEPFDVVLLDRKIPSGDGVLDDDTNHGWNVFQWITEHLPGTSVWFLTGTEDADFSTDVLNEFGRNGDIHACGRADSVYRVFWKRRMPDCVAALRTFREDISRTDSIALVQTNVPVNLRPEEARLIRLFGRRHGGTSVEVRQLSGGLSGARVLQATVRNSAGQPIITSIAKVGSFVEINVERDRFLGEIARLVPGSTPQITAELSLGAASNSGIFYGVVGTDVSDLFGKLTADPSSAADVPAQLRANQAPWFAAKEIVKIRVGAIRRRLLSDVEFAAVRHEIPGVDVGAIELLEVDAAECVQHGDLHCANVLFDDRGNPMIIDYPDTGKTLSCLDPITLELSTIFHSQAPDRAGWPTGEQAGAWPDIYVFSTGSSIEAYLRACRDWAIAEAGSEQEIWAVGYAYAVRQLKYDDTDKNLAREIIGACVSALKDNAP